MSALCHFLKGKVRCVNSSRCFIYHSFIVSHLFNSLPCKDITHLFYKFHLLLWLLEVIVHDNIRCMAPADHMWWIIFFHRSFHCIVHHSVLCNVGIVSTVQSLLIKFQGCAAYSVGYEVFIHSINRWMKPKALAVSLIISMSFHSID